MLVYDAASGAAVVTSLLSHRQRGTAEVAGFDVLGREAFERLRFRGVRRPEELALLRGAGEAAGTAVAVLGEAKCAGGEAAIVLRDTATRRRSGCYPIDR